MQRYNYFLLSLRSLKHSRPFVSSGPDFWAYGPLLLVLILRCQRLKCNTPNLSRHKSTYSIRGSSPSLTTLAYISRKQSKGLKTHILDRSRRCRPIDFVGILQYLLQNQDESNGRRVFPGLFAQSITEDDKKIEVQTTTDMARCDDLKLSLLDDIGR